VAPAAGVPIAIFPLQDFSAGQNDVDLNMAKVLSEALKQSGNEIIDVDTVIAFMANNRIRTVGQLEMFDAFRVRDQLGAGLVLLGTVTQRKKRPDPTLALTLSLVRTSDARTIWSYAGSVTTGSERKMLGIGELSSTEEMQPFLLEEMLGKWPWQRINEVQTVGAVNLDTITIAPSTAQPGRDIRCRVNVRDTWPANWAPHIFFKVDDQIYPATVSNDGKTIEGTWVAGKEDDRYTVYLVLEWALYRRSEVLRLGDYVVDGAPPLVEVQLKGGTTYEGRQVFNRDVVIVPSLIVPKPLERWRLSVNYKTDMGDDHHVGDMTGYGKLPETYVWTGRGYYGDGIYEFVVEAWDVAGNSGKGSSKAEYHRALPQAGLTLAEKDDGMVVDVDYVGKVPLRYWKIEMWTNEGRLIAESEGKKLPVQVEFAKHEALKEQAITGFVFLEDMLGKTSRVKIEDLLPELNKAKKPKEKKSTSVSESWVDDF
jgi:hypothetical protein